MKNKLKEIAKELIDLKSAKKFCSEKCEDIVIGRNGTFWFSVQERLKHKKDLNIVIDKKIKNIIILLESPHTREFKKTNPSNIFFQGSEFITTPALGPTGNKLKKYFPNILEKYCPKNLLESNYQVILMNSIQYQCSLGVGTKQFRDHVWLKLWYEKNFKEDFVGRVKKYNPSVIFNFCTKGDHTLEPKVKESCKKEINEEYFKFLRINMPKELADIKFITLKEVVSLALADFGKILIYESTHPFSWRNEPAVTQYDKDSISKYR